MTGSVKEPDAHTRIGVVVLSYQADPVMLAETVAALEASHAVLEGWAEILVAENGPITPELVHGPATSLVALGANHGFAGGINRAMKQLSEECEFVFLCNPDAIVAPDALTLCALSLMNAPSSVVSVAPKMLLAGHSGVIDAVGNCVNDRGEAANVGLGQPDIGQFDTAGSVTHVFGPCFGAGMFRRSAFDSSAVGPLDERMFMYYEDVDWNWRAQLLGYESITEPGAVVMHQMSSSTRHLAYDFKFHFTERNLMLCALKNFSGRRALRIWVTRSIGLLLGSVKGHYPTAGLKAVMGTLRMLPSTIALRRTVQRSRLRSDAQVTQFATKNRTFFDAVTYQPIDREAAAAFAKSLVPTDPKA
jgi:GT2 family glycosyltransferase